MNGSNMIAQAAMSSMYTIVLPATREGFMCALPVDLLMVTELFMRFPLLSYR
jgi:hypothetical protein